MDTTGALEKLKPERLKVVTLQGMGPQVGKSVAGDSCILL